VVKLDLKDFKSDGEIKIRSGKGRVDRTVYLSPGAIALVSDWIEIRTKTPGALLCQVNKSGRVVMQRLTPQAVLFILQKRGLEAGCEHFSPHDMRRTFVSDLLTAGTDIATVQSLAGHSNPAITARYDRRGEERKGSAARLHSWKFWSGYRRSLINGIAQNLRAFCNKNVTNLTKKGK